MGCDIHAAVEWCEPGIGWLTVLNDVNLIRHYRMFAAMVDGHGRAGEGERGVALARGLPPAPSDVRLEVEWYTHNDCPEAPNAVCHAEHTFSWLTAAEYHAAIELAERDTTPSPDYYALDAYLQRLARDGDVRLVFGFDS